MVKMIKPRKKSINSDFEDALLLNSQTYVDYLERIEYALMAYFRGNVKLIDNDIFELQKPE